MWGFGTPEHDYHRALDAESEAQKLRAENTQLRAKVKKLESQQCSGPRCPRCGSAYTQFSGCSCSR